MTCPYFSIKNGKILCNIYGVIEVKLGEIRKCHERYCYCFEEANRWLKEQQEKELVELAEREERVFLFNEWNKTLKDWLFE